MTSKERVRAIVGGAEFDRPAVIAPVSNATDESCKALRVRFPDVHLNAEQAAALAAYPCKKLGFDSAMPYFSVVLEAAALGAEIDWGSDLVMPSQKHPLYGELDQFRLPEDFLDMPSTAACLQAVRLLKKRHGDVFVLGKVMGPWTLGLHLCGVENFLMDTILSPQRIRDYLTLFSEITMRFAQAQLDAGADMITIADHFTADLVGPQMYPEFLQPVHEYILGRFPRNTFILHCCGKTTDRIAFFARAGFPVYHFESKNDIAEALNAAGDMVLTGCINNPETLLFGTPEDVRTATKKVLREGIRLVSPECAIPLQVRNANLLQISKTVGAWHTV